MAGDGREHAILRGRGDMAQTSSRSELARSFELYQRSKEGVKSNLLNL